MYLSKRIIVEAGTQNQGRRAQPSPRIEYGIIWYIVRVTIFAGGSPKKEKSLFIEPVDRTVKLQYGDFLVRGKANGICMSVAQPVWFPNNLTRALKQDVVVKGNNTIVWL